MTRSTAMLNHDLPARQRGWARTALIILLVAVGLGYLGFRYVQHGSDGPLNDLIPGGPLTSGPLLPYPANWTSELERLELCAQRVCDEMAPIELQLEQPSRSRWVGMMLHDGALYLPCDLGFMWGRFEGTQARVLELVYYLKTWHQDAARHGDAVLRLGGHRYEVELERVTDAGLTARLQAQLEDMARVWVAPDDLGPPPTEGPRDIWFFKVNER